MPGVSDTLPRSKEGPSGVDSPVSIPSPGLFHTSGRSIIVAYDLHTDGACSGNPGPGGWAAILTDRETGESFELTGSEDSTTNNRMEMLAIIEGLKGLEDRTEVLVITDSKYVVEGMNSWVHGWLRNGWKTSGKKPVKNQDLWQELIRHRDRLDLTFDWVQGHAGHPLNERADQLAVAAYQKYL